MIIGFMGTKAREPLIGKQIRGRERGFCKDQRRLAIWSLTLLTLVYAAFAGLRTVSDPDLGWQLATGRWIVQHHAIPRIDVLSYTAAGAEWTYPVLSQLLLYLVCTIGGFALLSWLSAVLTVGTTILLLFERNFVTVLLALLAVPVVAQRMAPRAEMFTHFLFALFVALLWKYHKTGVTNLLVLPIAMMFWVNLHPGFVAGLAMCGAYFLLESGEFFWRDRRSEAIRRLRRAAPYFLVTGCATLLNPWGPRIFLALVRQKRAMNLHSQFILEWLPLKVNAVTLSRALDWRDTRGTVFWLIFAAVLAIVVGIISRRYAAAAILAGSIYLVVHAERFQPLFAVCVVIIAGSLVAEVGTVRAKVIQKYLSPRALAGAQIAVFTVAALFVAVRISDLVTNRTYLRVPEQYSEFGFGAASWYPEPAANFILREHLPHQVFNEYPVGGYLAWRIGHEYGDYIDGRALPFGEAMFLRSIQFATEPPDSPDFVREVESRNINTVLLSLNYEMGAAWRRLNQFCSGDQWRAVYLGPDAAVFVRQSAENEPTLTRLAGLQCSTFDFVKAVPKTDRPAQVAKNYVSTAFTLLVLGRVQDSWAAVERASQYSTDSYAYHFVRGMLLQNSGAFDEAELEFAMAIDAGYDEAAFPLLKQYLAQEQFDRAVALLNHTIQISNSAFLLEKELGTTYLKMRQPGLALSAFDRAERDNPFHGEKTVFAEAFDSEIVRGRAEAKDMLANR